MKKIVIIVAVLSTFLLSSCILLWPMDPEPEGHGHSEYHHSEYHHSESGGGRRDGRR